MSSDKVALLEFEGNQNIGLYMFVNDKFCILGKELPEEKLKQIEDILKVPVYHVNVLGTELVGIFLSGDNEHLLVPWMYEHELEQIKEITKRHNVKLHILSERLNTFGNSLFIGSKGIVISSEYSKEFSKKLGKELDKKVYTFKTKEFSTPGSLLREIKGKCIASQDLSETEIKPFISLVNQLGSVNSGSSYIASGVIGNKNGILIGSACSSIEIQNLLETFEFL